MQQLTLRTHYALALLFAVTLASGCAFAGKPTWVDENKPGKPAQEERHDNNNDHEARHNAGAHTYFEDRQRVIIRDYYDQEYRSGHCPPGLAKKHNGCRPPGQIKKWRIGQPLPRDVIYYDLPPTIVVNLGQPPAGHRYVRVASDILLIAIGTGMVLDAIEDLEQQ